MTGWPDQPVIYEINTAVWLGELARAARRPVTLAANAKLQASFTDVFERDGDGLASPGLFVNLGPWQFHLLAVR